MKMLKNEPGWGVHLFMFLSCVIYTYYPLPVADPGFPLSGGDNSQVDVILQILCRKLHENERIWTPRGRAFLAPPLGSTNNFIIEM